MHDAEDWRNSTQETIFSPPWIEYLQGSVAAEFMRGTVNHYFDQRMHDKEHLMKRFGDHIEKVQATIAAERLLTFDVSQGWEPLCEFLEVPLLDEISPRINGSAATRELIDFVVDNGFEAILGF